MRGDTPGGLKNLQGSLNRGIGHLADYVTVYARTLKGEKLHEGIPV
jgi:hypothetical protein